MSDRTTPETDENAWGETDVVEADFARRLERQRDELLAACEWAQSQLGKHTRPSPLDKAIAAMKGEEE